MNLTQVREIIMEKLDKFVENKSAMYGFLFLLSIFTLFIFSTSSSPLFVNCYNGDGSFFQAMGDAVLAGKTPYTELFDHKGPVLFYLQALMQFCAPGKTGIFLTQVANLFLILIILLYTTRVFTRSSLHIFLSLCSFLLLFVLTIHHGNQTEEYSLLHSMVAVYLAVRFYFVDNRQISWWKGIILGLCFSLSFWMRANNAGMVSACFAFMFLILLMDKNWKQLSKITFAFVGTVVCFSLFVIAYFHSIGALEEMLNATFLFNLKYMGGGEILFSFNVAFLFISVLVAMVFSLIGGSYLLFKKNKDKNIPLFALLLLLFGVLPMCSIRMFDHYLTVAIPVFSVGLIFFFASGADAKYFRRGLWLLFIILILQLIPKLKMMSWCYSFTDDYEQVVTEIKSKIPPSEYDEVYAYDLVSGFYIISGIKPYYKYFLAQEFHGAVSGDLFLEIDSMFISHPPKWVVTEVDADTTTYLNPIITNRIKSDYVEYSRVSKAEFDLFLYKRKEK